MNKAAYAKYGIESWCFCCGPETSCSPPVTTVTEPVMEDTNDRALDTVHDSLQPVRSGSGEILYNPALLPDPHKCDYPHGYRFERRGTIFRCDCGQYWVRYYSDGSSWWKKISARHANKLLKKAGGVPIEK